MPIRLRDLRLIIMQVSKNFKSNRLLRIFERSNGISRIGDIHESTGDEWILGKCEKLSVGVFMRQELYRIKLKGFLEQRRAVRGILY